MSDLTTRTMLEDYEDKAGAPMYLTNTHFQSPPRNFFRSEEVEIDIRRGKNEIAVPVQELSSEARHNQRTQSSNKSYKPPVLKEDATVEAWELIKRQPGEHPFEPRTAAISIH